MRSNVKYLAVLSLSLLLAVVLFNSVPANAAFITTVMTEDFSDATIDPLLTNHNSTPISGGIADLNGSDAKGTAQGFTMDISSYNSSEGPTVSWIMEAIVPDASTTSNLDTLLVFNGSYNLTFQTGGGNHWALGYPDGATTVATPQNGDHVALVYTLGTPGTLAYYANGVFQTSATPSPKSNTSSAGFGLEVYDVVSISRGFDGSLDAIAFSTFTGTFDPAQGDQFAIPEPGTLALLATGLIGLLCYAWRKRK